MRNSSNLIHTHNQAPTGELQHSFCDNPSGPADLAGLNVRLVAQVVAILALMASHAKCVACHACLMNMVQVSAHMYSNVGIVPEATVTCVQDRCMPCDMYSANYIAAV